MHQPIRDNLEEVLQGNDQHDGHLATCSKCREAVNAMRGSARVLQSLCAPAGVEPAPGFYARVMERIEVQLKPAFWAAFLEPGFAKRIVFASLVFLVLFGGYLVSTESVIESSSGGPEVIMADTQEQPQIQGDDQQQDRDAILATLATYQEQ